LQQGTLADAHPAFELHNGAFPGTERRKRRDDLGELSFAAEVLVDARAAAHAGRLTEDDVAVDRGVFSPEAPRAPQAYAERAAQMRAGCFANQDAAHWRGVLEARGNVDRVA